MSASRSPFQYAVLRIVPRVERGEAVNAGVVLFCRPLRFLGARTHLDDALLAALAPGCDAGEVRALLRHDRADRRRRARTGGPIAALPASERFHWLVAPASTIVQAGPVHTGLTADPAGRARPAVHAARRTLTRAALRQPAIVRSERTSGRLVCEVMRNGDRYTA